MAEGMLTEGLKSGEYSEIELDGQVCRMYKDGGKIECKAPGDKEWTTRVGASSVVEGMNIGFKEGVER